MVKIVQGKYDMGDIIFVNKYSYEDNTKGENHLFVVINDDNKVVPLDYFGLIVSSQISKSKDKSIFMYNEPLSANTTNGLKTDSIVKCDQLYDIPKNNILFKIGHVDVDDFIRFLNTYNSYLKSTEEDILVTE